MTPVQAVLRGEIGAAARLMRDLDDGVPAARERLRQLFPLTGRAHILGVTGAPGAGKSSLTDQLIGAFRARGQTVGVVAIDPSSPFGGGAILGDRVRMQRHSLDPGVFVRSLATRGHLGGLSRSTSDIVDVMDAMGKDVVIVETVGVGQDEIDIMRLAETTLVVQVPGLGDDVQAIKAGILEIASIFVVNKADLEGADTVVRHLTAMLETRSARPGAHRPEIVKTEATRGRGISELVAAIDRHRDLMKGEGGEDRQRQRLERRFLDHLRDILLARGQARLSATSRGEDILNALAARSVDPFTAANRAADAILGADACACETA